jgi:pyruvate dehydrogenase E2 component (dihydrolipoamide acetyltransferase)
MPTTVIMPALELAQETGKVLKWLKRPGDRVTKGEPIVEIETDKVTVEVEAPAAGVLRDVTAQPGDVVPVGQTIALIFAAGEAGAGATPTPSGGAPAAGATPAASTSAAPAASSALGVKASPLARRVAEQHGVDLAAIKTASGRIEKADVLAHVERTKAPAGNGSATPARITYTDLLVRLVAATIAQQPRVNASWKDGTIVQHADINIGLAVAIDDGLVVPVLHRADTLSLAEIATRREDLVTRAQTGKLRPSDIQGGSFTISNLGMYGVDAFNAIVNPPQAAILAVGRITDRVVAVGGQPAVQPTMVLTLSCDHRALDGARAAQFLGALADVVEEPLTLLS